MTHRSFADHTPEEERAMLTRVVNDAARMQRDTLAKARQLQRERWVRNLWPCTIIRDRYSGTYSGGAWVAFPLDYDAIPAAVSGDDLSCGTFWGEYDPEDYGVGDSPEVALQDLVRKMGAG